jgi:hypothetical protein
MAMIFESASPVVDVGRTDLGNLDIWVFFEVVQGKHDILFIGFCVFLVWINENEASHHKQMAVFE